MSKYFAGIAPKKVGYEIASIKPNFGNLTEIYSKVTTVKGNIQLEAQKTENRFYMNIDLPTKGYIAVPKTNDNMQILFNNKTVYKKNKEKKNKIAKYDKEDKNYVYFYIEKGKYEIETK